MSKFLLATKDGSILRYWRNVYLSGLARPVGAGDCEPGVQCQASHPTPSQVTTLRVIGSHDGLFLYRIGGHFIRYQSGVGVWPEFSIKCDWPVWHPDLNLALGNLSLNQITGQLSGNNFNICTFLPMKLLGTLEFSVRMKLVRLSKTKNNNNIPRLLPISVRIFSRLPQNLTQTPYQD